MKNYLLVVIMLVLTANHANADVVVRAAEITAFGVFEERGKAFKLGYSATEPGTDTVDDVRFVGWNRQIPGEVGVSFGIQYIVHSRPKGSRIKIIARIEFPEGGLVTPQGYVYQSSEEIQYIKLGEENFYGFGFDETWEIVPGDWKFQIKYKNAIIAQKTLTVVADRESEEPE